MVTQSRSAARAFLGLLPQEPPQVALAAVPRRPPAAVVRRPRVAFVPGSPPRAPKRCRACRTGRKRFGAKEPTGAVCLSSHWLPQPPRFARFMLIPLPQWYAVVVPHEPRIPTPTRSAGGTSLPSSSTATTGTTSASPQFTLMTGQLPRSQPWSAGRWPQPPADEHASHSANATSCADSTNARSIRTWWTGEVVGQFRQYAK